MNANKFLPPPVRLSQAFESERFSDGASGSEITRRSFLKRTGGATVATLVAWNLASQQASANPESSDSVSHKMCAISPQNGPGNPDAIGYFSLPHGGYIILFYKDQGCYFNRGDAHSANSIGSIINIRAEAYIPAKTSTVPWGLEQPLGDAEISTFSFEGSAIVRAQEQAMGQLVFSRNLNGELPAGSNLDLWLEIVSVVRTNYSVTVTAKAWLEGTAAGVIYDPLLCADGYGISLVVTNEQEPHSPDQCQCAV